MGGGTNSGQIVNLGKQDFAGLVALATLPAGEMFFAGVFDGAIPEVQYAGEGPSVYIGVVESENDEEILLLHALLIEPRRLRDIQTATNYCPRDCMRGLWFDLKTLDPSQLTRIAVSKMFVTRRFRLDTNAETCDR